MSRSLVLSPLTLAAALALAGGLYGCSAASDSIGACDPAVEDCDEARGSSDTGGRPVVGSDAGTGAGTDGGGGGGTDGGGAVFPDTGGGPISCDTRTCDEITAAGEALTDTDLDGIPDCVEGGEDVDGDGEPNCNDTDSDGDGLFDSDEGFDDPDVDGIPAFLDADGDNDGIDDRFEGPGDVDEDGIPNARDDDSDGDGISDRDEYGQAPGSGARPADTDRDGVPDFLDLDSDGDGLPDSDETGCGESTDRLLADSDGDNFSDLVEIAFGSDPCDIASDITPIVDFYFELPYRGDPASDTLEFGTDVSRGDVVFNMDTTGSMSGEISTLRSTLSSTIIPQLTSRLESVAIGVSHFDDFPCGSYGGGADVPFRLLQRVTTDASAAQSGVNSLPQHGGGDYFESGIESLYQIASGAGWSGGCYTVPPFNPGAGMVPGTADGEIGGAGFRSGSVPIIVHITDAPSHANGESGYPYGASRAQMYDALNAVGGRVIGVASGGDARSDLEGIARETNSLVPTCAWDGIRPGGCGAGQCCTGTNGAGRAPDGSGNCTLVFDINSSGAGLDTSIISGIEALVNFAPINVTTRVRRDEDEFAISGIDTSLFITNIIPVGGIGSGDGACSTEPAPTDFDGDGTLDGFANVTPGSQLFFQVDAQNEHVRPSNVPLVFLAYIDVMAGPSAVLDTRIVTVLVPPDLKQ